MNEMRNGIVFGLSARDNILRPGRRSRDWMRRLEALSSAIGSIVDCVNKYRLLLKLTKQMTYCISLITQALIVSSLLKYELLNNCGVGHHVYSQIGISRFFKFITPLLSVHVSVVTNPSWRRTDVLNSLFYVS